MKAYVVMIALCLAFACSPIETSRIAGDTEESVSGYITEAPKEEQPRRVAKGGRWFKREYVPKHDTSVSDVLYVIAEELGMNLDKAEFRRRMDDPKRAEVF